MSTSSTPGRRAAPRRAAPRRRPQPAPGIGAALVLLVLCAGLLAAAGLVEGGQGPSARRDVVPVDRVVTSCLGSPVPARTAAHTLAAPLPGGVGEAGARGGLEVTAPTGGSDGAAGSGEVGRGRLVPLGPVPAGSTLTVTATGSAAVGRTGSQVDRARGTSALSARECATPRGRWWFTGGGADLDHSSELVLANVDPGRAVVDIVVHGPEGEVPTLGTRGVTLEQGDVRSFEMVELAPQAEDLSVRVEAARGRVVAGMSDSFSDGPAAAEGLEWLPAQAEASRVLRLAPLPRRAAGRSLVVANPSDREVLVEVEVSGEGGAFAPADAAQLRVPPGAVVSSDLSAAVGRDASAVVLRAPVPVAATVRSVTDGDTSYAAATPPLTGPAAAILARGASASVQLTAAGTGGRVEVVAYDETGDEVDRQEVELEPGATGAWSPRRSAAYVVATPAEGRVAGGVVLSDESGTTQLALRPLPVTVRQPAVAPVVR